MRTELVEYRVLVQAKDSTEHWQIWGYFNDEDEAVAKAQELAVRGIWAAVRCLRRTVTNEDLAIQLEEQAP